MDLRRLDWRGARDDLDHHPDRDRRGRRGLHGRRQQAGHRGHRQADAGWRGRHVPREALELDGSGRHLQPAAARGRHGHSRLRPVGPRRQGNRSSSPQAARRRTRPGEGLRQHLPKHGRPGGLRGARPELQEAGLRGLQGPRLHMLGPPQMAARAPAAGLPQGGRGGLQGRARGSRRRHGPDARPLRRLYAGGGHMGRQTASGPRLLLARAPHDRDPYAGVPAPHPGARHRRLLARARARRPLQQGRVGYAGRSRHAPHRLLLRRGDRLLEANQRVPGLRPQVRASRERLAPPPAGCGRARGHLRVLRARPAPTRRRRQ